MSPLRADVNHDKNLYTTTRLYKPRLQTFVSRQGFSLQQGFSLHITLCGLLGRCVLLLFYIVATILYHSMLKFSHIATILYRSMLKFSHIATILYHSMLKFSHIATILYYSMLKFSHIATILYRSMPRGPTATGRVQRGVEAKETGRARAKAMQQHLPLMRTGRMLGHGLQGGSPQPKRRVGAGAGYVSHTGPQRP